MIHSLIAIFLAYILDRFIGDPPHWPHPVKGFGFLIHRFDHYLNKGNARRTKGLLMVLLLGFMVYSLSVLCVYFSYKIHWSIGVGVEAILIATTIAHKGLKEAALQVAVPLKQGDLVEARKQLAKIVGRDTENLDEKEIVRGAVETVAENICDGIVAPIFWAMLGGAPLALVYRLINTCDSMVGYMSDLYIDFGRASAKIDDFINYVPARITGFAMMLVHQPPHTSYKKAWKILFQDVQKHASPNSGWGEVPMAILLGVRLGGTNFYHGKPSVRAYLGRAYETLAVRHIDQAISVMHRTVIAFFIFLMIGGGVFEITFTWFKSTISL